MQFKNKSFNRFWRFSTSFQLGIPIMVAIAVLIAWGTIVESQYDAYAAKKLVYESWYMWTAMGLLIYNLTVVVVDRWPWQWRHYPFITVHAGIIILILGGYVTYKKGLDGQMIVNIGSKNNKVSIPQTDLVVYATFDGDRYTKVTDREVDFFSYPPTKEKPMVIQLGEDKIEILEYIKYARLQNKVVAGDNELLGSSVRFQLMNAQVKQIQQITQTKKDKLATFNFGPAKVHVGAPPAQGHFLNEIFLTPDGPEKIKYTVFHKEANKPFKTGSLKIGDVVSTGWMGLELRILDYLPKAIEEYEITPMERPTPLTTAAIRIKHKETEKWLALNDVVKLFGTSSAYIMSYQNRHIELGFDLKLNKFEVSRYQGTMKAMEYASEVEAKPLSGSSESPVSEIIPPVVAKISMNEPLKYKGYTIYQASFQEDEMTGEPIASVYSINQDPGRWIKYLGSIIFSLGVIWLFYQRRKRATAV